MVAEKDVVLGFNNTILQHILLCSGTLSNKENTGGHILWIIFQSLSEILYEFFCGEKKVINGEKFP